MSMSYIHRNTGRRSYPSAANDIGFLLDQLCRLIWSMLDCISHSMGVPGGAVTPDGDQSVGRIEASFTATHLQSNIYATCLAWVHHSARACHHLLPLVDIPNAAYQPPLLPPGLGVSSVGDCPPRATESGSRANTECLRYRPPASSCHNSRKLHLLKDSLRVEVDDRPWCGPMGVLWKT